MHFAIRGEVEGSLPELGMAQAKTYREGMRFLRFSHKDHWWLYLKIKVQRVAGLHLMRLPNDKKLELILPSTGTTAASERDLARIFSAQKSLAKEKEGLEIMKAQRKCGNTGCRLGVEAEMCTCWRVDKGEWILKTLRDRN